MKKPIIVCFLISILFLGCYQKTLLITDTSLLEQSKDLALDSTITVTFSEEITDESLSEVGNIVIWTGETNVLFDYEKQANPLTIELTPLQEFEGLTEYSLLLSDNLLSIENSRLKASVLLNFTTTVVEPTVPPVTEPVTPPVTVPVTPPVIDLIPTIEITSPDNDLKSTNNAVLFQGSYDDDNEVVSVKVSINSSDNFVDATLKDGKLWEYNFTDLSVGSYVLRAYSVDNSNNLSIEDSVSFTIIELGTPVYEGNYYDAISVPTESSDTFKQVLQALIDDHQSQGYDWSCTEVDYNLPTNREGINPENSTISCYYNRDTTIVKTIVGHIATYSGDDVNREHTVPKSWMKGGTGTTEGNDVHNLITCDIDANSSRGNSPLGPNGYDVIPDWHKGNAARIHFYMYTRYSGDDWAGKSGYANGTNISASYEAMLRQWHIDDPVDEYEFERNNRIYAKQGNRNPFVDNPHWVDLISDF